MLNPLKISIIIPIYNVEEYIEACLLSVMRQTYTGEMECILIDDCGNDHSIDIAQKLISEYKGSIVFHILHHERNRGLSAARNTGTAAATGDYVYYLDSDDYISDDCIKLLAAPLRENDYDIVFGDYQMFGSRQDATLLTEEREVITGNERIFASYADRKIYVMAWNKLCRLSFLRDNDITFLEGQLHEDELWTYKTMLSIQSIKIVHEIIYFYRVRANSIATDTTKAQQKIISYSDTVKFIQTHPYRDDKSFVKCLEYYWTLYLYIARESRVDFLSDYRKLRNLCPVTPIKYLINGSATLRQIRAMWHFAFPPMIAYWCLRLRYKRVNNNLG